MTALVSVIPILLLIVLMMGFKVSGYKSAVTTLVVTILLALFAVPAMGIVPEKNTGMTNDIAKGLVLLTGAAFPFFAPLIGSIGTFVTGSATNANILFGKLQATAASDLGLVNQGTFFGVSGNETNWLAAANCAGSEGGKLLSPQSIAIATAACDMEGQDGDIMRKTMPFAIFWILMNGLMVFLGLHVF